MNIDKKTKKYYNKKVNQIQALLAQLVEQRTLNPKVQGSTP